MKINLQPPCTVKMALNTSIFQGVRGVLRIVTLVIGIIDLGIVSSKYVGNLEKEEFFLSIVIIAFIISLIWTIVLLAGLLASAEHVKNIDQWFHIIGGILLIISAIVFLVSVFDIADPCDNILYTVINCPRSWYILRIIAGILGLLNGIVYVVLGVFVFQNKN